MAVGMAFDKRINLNFVLLEVHQYQELKNPACLQPKMPPCDFVPEKYDVSIW